MKHTHHRIVIDLIGTQINPTDRMVEYKVAVNGQFMYSSKSSLDAYAHSQSPIRGLELWLINDLHFNKRRKIKRTSIIQKFINLFK